jgi:GNAT superfamily N-acetyltransferase
MKEKKKPNQATVRLNGLIWHEIKRDGVEIHWEREKRNKLSELYRDSDYNICRVKNIIYVIWSYRHKKYPYQILEWALLIARKWCLCVANTLDIFFGPWLYIKSLI